MDDFLTCRALLDFLDDYVEERLAPSERARFEEHLEVCDACVRYLKSYRGTVGALARFAAAAADEDAAVPEDVPRQLVRAILEARRAAG